MDMNKIFVCGWHQVIPFFLCELQSKWIAGVLSGRISLPSKEDMNADIEAFYSSMGDSRIPKRYTHNMDDYQVQPLPDNLVEGFCFVLWVVPFALSFFGASLELEWG